MINPLSRRLLQLQPKDPLAKPETTPGQATESEKDVFIPRDPSLDLVLNPEFVVGSGVSRI